MSLPGFQQLSPDLCVAGQLDTAAMDWAAKAGFKSVINNRPDFEGGPDQPTSASIEGAARTAGLRYAHLPVAPGLQTPAEVEQFARLMEEMPKPILAFCRSGARSGKLYRAAIGG
jgi:uncharacterized protein (TIGR01244 family)